MRAGSKAAGPRLWPPHPRGTAGGGGGLARGRAGGRWPLLNPLSTKTASIFSFVLTACPFPPEPPHSRAPGTCCLGANNAALLSSRKRSMSSVNTLFTEGSPKNRHFLGMSAPGPHKGGCCQCIPRMRGQRPRAGSPTWPRGGGAVEGPGDQESSSWGPCLQPCTIPPGNAYCRQTSRIIASPQLYTAAGAADAQAWGRPLGSRIPQTTVSGTTHGGNEKGAFRDANQAPCFSSFLKLQSKDLSTR